jgi:hypothetical protein
MSQGMRILYKAARPIVGTTSPPILTHLLIFVKQSGRNVNLTSRLVLVTRLRLRGATPPFPCVPLCLVLKLITETTLQSPRSSANTGQQNLTFFCPTRKNI